MNLKGFGFHILLLLVLAARDTGSRCEGHLLPDARGCRVLWAGMAEVAQWGTPASRIAWLGISCLMSAVTLSHGLRQLM